MSRVNSKKAVKKRYIKKAKRKKIKYRKIAFKFTDSQRKALDHYCRVHRTTPVRFIKNLVNKRVERYRDKEPGERDVTPNQLSLFDVEEQLGQK